MQAEDVKPSVPRTPAQSVLRVVSIIMAILGATVLLGGVLVLLTDPNAGIFSGNFWAVITFGVIVLAIAGLLLLTAALGIAASNNSSRVGPYRFLCYLVGLVVLVAIVWGWGTGTFILFNPIVLTVTIVYVLICSTLADKVQDEHDHGVRGETFLRSRHQRALHLLAEVILVKGALAAALVATVGISALVYGPGATIEMGGTNMTVNDLLVFAIGVGIAVAALDLVVGGLGIWGSNRPQKIKPFMVVSALVVAFDVFQIVSSTIMHGHLSAPSVDILLDLLFMGACTYLSYQISHQPLLPDPTTTTAA